MSEKVNIGGILFDNVTMDEAVTLIENKIKDKKIKSSSLVALANQDIINRIKNVKGLDAKSINKNSFLILPDGNSIVLASRILKAPLKERVAGPDLMEKMMIISNKKGYKNFLLGAREETSLALYKNLKKKFPKLNICGRYSPPFGDFPKKENDKMLDLINKSKADLLWVSFGCPKQEKWIIENINKIKVNLSFGIGAAFDFLSGETKRAPKFIQQIKMEWFYRLMQEPKRLWKRYLYGGLSFAFIILRQIFIKNK